MYLFVCLSQAKKTKPQANPQRPALQLLPVLLQVWPLPPRPRRMFYRLTVILLILAQSDTLVLTIIIISLLSIQLILNCNCSRRRLPRRIWEHGCLQSRISSRSGLHVRHWTYGSRSTHTKKNSLKIIFFKIINLLLWPSLIARPRPTEMIRTLKTAPLITWLTQPFARSCPTFK